MPTRVVLIGRLVAFGLIFAVLQFWWEALRGSAIERVIIGDITVRPAAFLLNALWGGVRVDAVGFSLMAEGSGITVRNGCEGLEALFLLAAGLAVAPIPWVSRFLGLLIGIPIVYLINQLRIVGLFLAYRADPSMFDSLHATIAPITIVLAVVGYYYVWLAKSRPVPPTA
ncbi:MAG: exosortase/archaeosortase family protein [Gammaproteobacteria bacterium]